MLRFEVAGRNSVLSAIRPTHQPPLPFYIEPAPEEALFSWLLRLSTRLGVSVHALASHSFGVDDRNGATHWWVRPHPWILKRISERTGVSVARLRQMTSTDLEPVYRDDEAAGRFSGRRFDVVPPERRSYRFAICGACVQGDPQPYLRKPWLIGWVAVCPVHQAILIERCEHCHSRLRVPAFSMPAAFSPSVCPRCGEDFLNHAIHPAARAVIDLQAAMLAGKTNGIIELSGLGQFTWKEFVALTDILLSGVWKSTTMDERGQLFDQWAYEAADEPRDEPGLYDGRHDGLRFLAWLFQGWPDGEGAQVAQLMLGRWLFGGREFSFFTSRRNGLDEMANRRTPFPRWSRNGCAIS